MHLALLGLAFQFAFSSFPAQSPEGRVAPPAADSVRDLKRARNAQASFEYSRRQNLPEHGGSEGRCDVHLGRFCWWYDETLPTFPPEAKTVTRRRDELVAFLDSLASQHPGDEWIAGMRVHYRIDGGNAAAADSVARECHAASWWCLALAGYAEHVLGQSVSAETSFVDAFGAMPQSERCAWRDISSLLPGQMRGRYEKLSCDARAAVEARYWLLSRPQLGRPANEWRTEFYVRRVQARLAERAINPQPGGWGRDAEELVLRYGWPMGWSKVTSSPSPFATPSVIGHDPVPSFAFAPTIDLLDSLPAATDDAWQLHEHLAESRFAPRLVHRVAPIAAQLARFRRGDSTLLVAAYAIHDDSLSTNAPAIIGATVNDGRTFTAGDSSGHAMLALPQSPVLVGVEIADTVTRTLGRTRQLFAQRADSSALMLSDLLLYRSGDSPPGTLDSALAAAIPGDTVSRTRPVGIFWETYGLTDAPDSLNIAVTVERIDRSWLRSARQRVHLAAPDSPLKLLWSDARPPQPGGATPRAVSLDLANLEPGRYRLTVTMHRTKDAAVSSSRDLTLGEH